jgi:hypothetical protein
MSTAAAPPTAHPWDRVQNAALVVGAAGVLLCVAGAVVSPAHFFRAWLVGFNFWLGVALGCMVLLMVQHLTGGAWGILLRRILEAGSRTLLPLAVFAVPLLFGLRLLYPMWADPDRAKDIPEVAHKSVYLNVPGFVIRLAIYFVVWLVLAAFLNRWSARQDEDAPAGVGSERRFRLLSAPGLALYGLTITFASVDWLMSLEPRWYSTIYPVVFGVGQALEGIAFAALVLVFLAAYPPLSAVVRPVHFRDVGNLLLLFVMMWAYVSFSQYLLIWAENLPEETPWYLRRLRGGWGWVALLLVFFQFVAPFVFLLFRDVKEDPRRLAGIARLVLVMRFVDVCWWTEAAFQDVSWYVLLDVAAAAGMGGLWLWWFLWQLGRRPLLPLHDPFLPEYLPEAVQHG